jgi:hypothetical protein
MRNKIDEEIKEERKEWDYILLLMKVIVTTKSTKS